MGAVLCLLYDVFRILRMAFPPGKISAFIQDVLWFAIAAVATYMMCLARCRGEVRSYIIIGEVSGFILFRLTVSRLLMLAARPVIRTAKRLIRTIKSAILRTIVPFISKILNKIKKIKQETLKKTKKHLHLRMPLLYNRRKKNVLSNSDTE